ncbi:MAG: hypothetical protein ACERKN_20765 [Velocimicrobium sp.]
MSTIAKNLKLSCRTVQRVINDIEQSRHLSRSSGGEKMVEKVVSSLR